VGDEAARVIAVISDIHANLEALEAVLADAARENAKRVICLGDVVGYGADPNACVERVHEKAAVTVVGNHDAAILNEHGADNFNHVARAAILWTREQLTPENTEFLRRLPVEHVEGGARFVHSSPDSPLDWNYVLTESDARAAFDPFEEAICFIGHSHVPARVLLEPGGAIEVVHEPDFQVPEGGRALVNVGSVGQPRDGNPQASYALFDEATRRVFAKRVDYDRVAAAAKIIDAGLPEVLARRLALGR
jgi:diadenosine tetraphosphatase ApaH/serine/threonine PP2A family protein phosphatase